MRVKRTADQPPQAADGGDEERACEEELHELLAQRRELEYNTTAVLLRPHSITAMILLLAWLVYVACFRSSADPLSNARWGLFGVVVAFLLFAMLKFPDSLFRRPHPLVWRVVLGVGVLYMLALTFLLFQNVDDARQMMTFLDPALGKPLPERDYAVNCQFYTPDDPESNFRYVRDAIKDEFFIAHAVGWLMKMLLMRDVRLTLFASALFELMELSLRHILPNFAECWWDHIILDLIVTNGFGIIAGYFLVRFFEMRTYNWAGTSRGTAHNIKRAVNQLTPESWTPYNWAIFSSWKRFLYFLFLLFMIEMVEIGCFFLKFLLWIPPPHPIVIGRLVVMFFVVGPALREYYQFIIDPKMHVFGPNAWICCAVVLLETLITLKWGRTVFTNVVPPRYVCIGWGVALACILATLFVYFPLRSHLEHRRKAPSAPAASHHHKKTK
eukprot:m51a1_g179 hypothetical protein (441) ;mRNA; r:591800-593862